MTLRIRMYQLDDAEQAYREKFGCAAPEHIHGCQFSGDCQRTELLERAVRQGMPLAESEYGKDLARLEAEYAQRFGVTPRIGFLWYKSGEESLQDRIAIVKESLETGRRRLMIEYGDGDDFRTGCLPEKYNFGLLMELWLDANGRPILAGDVNVT